MGDLPCTERSSRQMSARGQRQLEHVRGYLCCPRVVRFR